MKGKYEKYNCPVCATEHNLTKAIGEIKCLCGATLYVLPDGFGNKTLVEKKEAKNEQNRYK